MKKINQYFLNHPVLSKVLLWSIFAIALIYALIMLFVLPDLNLYVLFVLMLPCFYFFWIDKKTSYDPKKDRFSDEYVPPKYREKK